MNPKNLKSLVLLLFCGEVGSIANHREASRHFAVCIVVLFLFQVDIAPIDIIAQPKTA